MVPFEKPPFVTPQDYLKRERQAEMKSEYEDGQIVAMAGAKKAHNRITFDLGRSLGNQLEGKNCEPFSGDMRVRVPHNRYYYPDITTVCGEAEFEDGELDTLLNPTLIVEVLSDSTERRDRVVKFDAYRTLKSLNTYLLVAQDQPRIECFTLHADGLWRHEVVLGLEAVLALPAIGCVLRLSDVYARVRFEAGGTEPTEATDITNDPSLANE